MHLQGHFIDSAHGKLLLTQTGQVTGNTAILCLPPLMDEMNMSRAVIAKQCQFLSEHGYSSFVLDYFGCGDSEGEFEQADCNIWLDNIVTASQWLACQGINRLIIFAYRFSALLVGASQAYLLKHTHLQGQVFFKPIMDGQLYLKQLRRLTKASHLLSKGKTSSTNNAMTDEIAGYTFSHELFKAIEALNIKQSHYTVPTTCVDLASSRVGLPIQQFADENKTVVHAQYLAGQPFWQVPEIFDVPALNEQSLVLVNRLCSHG